MPNDIRSDVVAFLIIFLSEASPTKVDRNYGAVLRVILFYIWRGCSLPNQPLVSLEKLTLTLH